MSAASGDNAAEAGDKDGEDDGISVPPASESNAVAADEEAGVAGPDATECLQGLVMMLKFWGWRDMFLSTLVVIDVRTR